MSVKSIEQDKKKLGVSDVSIKYFGQVTSFITVTTAVTPIVLGEMRSANILPINRPEHATFEN